MKSEDWAERAFAIEALGTIGDSKGINAVKKLALTEIHPFVKRKIAETIEKLEAGQK